MPRAIQVRRHFKSSILIRLADNSWMKIKPVMFLQLEINKYIRCVKY